MSQLCVCVHLTSFGGVDVNNCGVSGNFPTVSAGQRMRSCEVLHLNAAWMAQHQQTFSESDLWRAHFSLRGGVCVCVRMYVCMCVRLED